MAGYIYEWEVPEGWEILGGQGESSVYVKAGRYDGTIKVTANKGDCRSQTATMFEDIIEPPGVFGLTGSQAICEGGSFTLSLSGSVEGYNYTLISGETTVETKAGINAPLTFGTYTTAGTYRVFSNLSGDCFYPMDGEAIITIETLSIAPVSIAASAYETCINENVILSVYGGILGKGASWKWYEGACDGSPIATGSSISVKPAVNTTYYVRAEGICNITTCASTSINVVSCLSRDTLNYLRIRTQTIPGFATLPVNLSPEYSISEYVYLDELGRNFQRITEKGSPLKNDLFSINVYDQYGRETFQYLPAVIENNSGLILSDPVGTITNFYKSTHSSHPVNVAETGNPFSKIIFENSPQSNLLKQGMPGSEWQPDSIPYETTQDHSVKRKYEINGISEVLNWVYSAQLNDSLGMVNASSGGTPLYYDAHQLLKNRTKDEENNEVVEYIDKQGRTILKKAQLDSTIYAQTYYIYDDFNNLVCVIPPEAVKNILASPSQFFGKTEAEKENFLTKWAFRYKYDARKRMIIKQVPGASPVYMVYDNRDRLVLTQDGNQRATAPYFWTFTKYDELNRPILTGIKDTAVLLSQAQMQTVVNYHYTKTGAQWGEKYGASEPIHGYSNLTYPMYTSAATVDPNHYLTVTYYDSYDFRDQWLDTYTYTDEELDLLVNDVLYQQPDTESLRVIGQVTGSKVKVLDGGIRGRYTWLKTVSYYDDKYRPIQSIADNYKGGKDMATNLYDFTGKVLKTKVRHTTKEISWKELVNTVVVGNNLVKTYLGSGWSAGGVTAEQLPAGVDGWIECVISEPDQKRAFGLTEMNEGEHRNTIDYAFWHDATAAKIYENGSVKHTLTGAVQSGDVIRIERTGTTIKYYKNGVFLYSSLTPSTTALIGDASIDSGSGNILIPRASFVSKADSVMRRFVYDHAGRLSEVWHQINAAPEFRISHNEYNELGQLVDKKLHSTDPTAASAVQSIDYRYNIRGWLTGMNENNLSNGDAGDPDDYFSFQLGYNNDIGIGNAPMFNGNISAMKWSTNLGLGDEKMNAYNYSYDNMNRITAAAFKTGTGTPESLTWSTPAGDSFSESGYSYDLNGNIMGLAPQRKKWK